MSNLGEDDYPMEEKYPLTEEQPLENASEKKDETVVVVQTHDGVETSVPGYYIAALVLSLLACFCVPFFGVVAIIFSSLGIEERRDRAHSEQVRCGHRCKAICGLVLAVFTIVLVITAVCVGAAFFQHIMTFLKEDVWNMLAKQAKEARQSGVNATTVGYF